MVIGKNEGGSGSEYIGAAVDRILRLVSDENLVETYSKFIEYWSNYNCYCGSLAL